MRHGDIVVVLGKMNQIRPRNVDELVYGTYIGELSDKRVVVLLPDGEIFTGFHYEIAPIGVNNVSD